MEPTDDYTDLYNFRTARKNGTGFTPMYGDFTGLKVQRVAKRGRLPPGEYYVVIENPTLGIMTRVTTFDVHLRIELRP